MSAAEILRRITAALDQADIEYMLTGSFASAYHGVPRIHPGTADPATGLTHGRLNLTLRETGL